MNTTQAMDKGARLGLVAFAAAMMLGNEAMAGKQMSLNPPSECAGPGSKCGCPEKTVTSRCIKVTVGLGETTPWSGSLECSLKIFADSDSPSIFTADSLYAVLGGYTFKRLGHKAMADGVTPAEVVLSHPNGEPIHFVFADGESWGRPNPGVHIKMDERLMMVDAEGWAATHDPVYYDLYVGDGSRRRFLATNMTGGLGSLVSITDARGVTVTPADMGVDIVYDSNGVRQFLTPSRLANVTQTAGFTGYDVAVYAMQEAPAKDVQTGLYAVPAAQPVELLSVRRENDGRRAVVTVQKGGGESLSYVFDYAMGEWSLTRPSGAEERRERQVADERAAKIVTSYVSSGGEQLERTEYNYKWESWGFAMTNKVEGFDGVTDTTEWTYYASGNGKGQVKTEMRQSGLLTQYTYDSVDRVTSETRSGPDMMTEVTTYSYTPVDPSDPVLPVDTRPRTVVKTLNNIECERTYYVYSPLTNIVERVGTQGAAYGGTNVLRTVTTFYPVGGEAGSGNGGSVGSSVPLDRRAGFVQSIRHEDGTLDLYDYELASNLWTRTITHLHEQSPSPVSGKTTRDITVTNSRGEILEEKTEAYIDGIWYTIAREAMTYNSQGKRIRSENLASQVTTTAWDCCHKVSETEPDGSTTTWDYDDEGRMIASSRLIPLDMTNVTWLTTCYEYDDLGRQTATWQTNYTAQVGLPIEHTRYDQLGRAIARMDQLGNTTTTSYSPDGRTVSVLHPNTSTTLYTRSASGDTLSVTGTAVTPEFHFYSVTNIDVATSSSPSQISCRVHETRYGSASSPRFTRTYENLLGQTIRSERSGFQGAVLATTHSYDSLGRLVSTSADYEPTTEYTYDVFGNRIATIRMVGTFPRNVRAGEVGTAPRAVHDQEAADGGRVVDASLPDDAEWRKTETLSSFVLDGETIWLTQTNTISCSDATIAPLVSSSSRQLTGLTSALPSRSRSTDTRGNVTESETLVDSVIVTSRQTLPYATNKPLSISRYGVSLMDVSVSAVTNTVSYDSLGRQISATDGRGNTRFTEYNSFGQRSASIDALGNRTIYAYNQFGNLTSVTDPLGNATIYEYDLRGRKTYEGGATYPVRYTYDVFGNRAMMMTYRNESLGPDSGDVTTWLYDEASDCMTNKVYADGKGPTYSYAPDGKLVQRIWARGIVTDYSYDNWGNLTNTVYSDNTPTVSLSYDALGRKTGAHDAAGITSFLYDSFGALTNETVIGVAGTNSIDRFYDTFGRDAGYALNAIRQTTLDYELATDRLTSMKVANDHSSTPNSNSNSFTWNYLAGSDLKCSLAYPNGLAASWTYDANNHLLQVCNAAPTNIISQYDYVYDAAGRRVQITRSGSGMSKLRTDAYGYNIRNELISSAKIADVLEYAYEYDDIGNRLTSFDLGTNLTYTANNLNQYTQISSYCDSTPLQETFRPQFDADGNQTLIQTETGVWQVSYNGENRPVLWLNGTNTITMSYDSKGRRVVMNGQFFVYDNYLQIVNFGVELQTFIWDPTEIFATRPLMASKGDGAYYYLHDGNKNVCDVVASSGGAVSHYDYTPFGALSFSTCDSVDTNPWRFSSEYLDINLGLSYYNYRHYSPRYGRWMSIDFFDYAIGYSPYRMLFNDAINEFDLLGLKSRHSRHGRRRRKSCKKVGIGRRVCKGVEECRTLDPKPGYNPSVNGCGSGWSKYLVPDRDYLTWLALEDADFGPACDNHDRCYGTCGKDRLECNKRLEDDMKKVCDTIKDSVCRRRCNGLAELYRKVLDTSASEGPYQDAQDQACDWKPCCELERTED